MTSRRMKLDGYIENHTRTRVRNGSSAWKLTHCSGIPSLSSEPSKKTNARLTGAVDPTVPPLAKARPCASDQINNAPRRVEFLPPHKSHRGCMRMRRLNFKHAGRPRSGSHPLVSISIRRRTTSRQTPQEVHNETARRLNSKQNEPCRALRCGWSSLL